MPIPQSIRLAATLVPFFVCFFSLIGACQTTNVSADASGKGTIYGHLYTAGHPYRKPLAIDLVPVNGSGHAYSTQSKINGSFSFHSVRPGGYRLIVHTHPILTQLVNLYLPTVNIDIDISAQKSSFSRKDARSKPAQPHPRSSISFSIAGVHGTTAPSGYSAGASEEATSHAMQHLAHLASSTSMFAGSEVPGCSKAHELMHEWAATPSDFQINLKLGIFYLAHGDYPNSIRHLLIAHNGKPLDLSCSRDLALAYLAAKHFADAVALLHDTTTSYLSDPSLYLLSADAYRGEGNRQMARMEFLQAIKYGKSVQDFFMAGAGLLEIGYPGDATKSFERGIKAYPNSAKLFMGLGISQSVQYENADALSSFMHAVQLDPGYAPTYQFLARMISGSRSGYQRIMQLITAFVATHPENADAHYDYALALWEHSREDISIQQLDEIAGELHLAVGLNATHSGYYFLLGVINSENHQLQQAAINFKKSLALDPSDAEAHYRLSLIYRQLGKDELARKELQTFLKLRNGQRLSAGARHALGSDNETIAVITGSVAPCQQP